MPEGQIAVPKGWTVQPLSDCVDILDSRRKPINSKERAARAGDVPYYGATGQVGWIDDYLFDEELVLLGEDGAPFLDKTKSIAYLVAGRTWVNNHAHVLRARSNVTSNRFVKYYLDSFDFTHRVHGSTREKLTQHSMKTIPVLLPPRDEQDRIVDVIEALRASRESAASHLATSSRLIERFSRSVLSAAVSGRLTVDWRATHPLEAISADQPRAKSPVQPSTDTPEEWAWCHLADIADLRGGVQKGAALRPGVATREVPYLRVANVQRGWLDLSEMKTIFVPASKVDELRLLPGDILFNEGGDRDKLGRGWVWEGQIPDCIHQNHVFRARLRAADFEPRFFSWYGNTFGAEYFVDQGKQTVNLASLNMSSLKSLPVPVPSPAEQREIVRRVERLLSAAEGLTERLDAATSRVELTSQAVLRKVFRGELVTDG